MKRFEIFFGIIKIPVDFLMTVLAFLTAYNLRLLTDSSGYIKEIDFSVLPTQKEYLIFSLYSAIALIVIFALGKMYSLLITNKFAQEAKKPTALALIWIMATITYFYFTRTFPFSRLAMAYSWLLTMLFIITGRGLITMLQQTLLKSGYGKRTLLFIGDNKISKEISQQLALNPSYKILDIIGKEKIKDLEKIIKRRKVDEIIQTQSRLSETQGRDVLELCDIYHIKYRFVPDLVEVRRSNIEVQTIGVIPIIALKPTPLDGWGRVYKRLLDFTGALLALIILSPILLITAIAIKMDSKGPIIFSKLDDGSSVKRVGKHGKLFKFYKFRSMQPKTDNLRYTKLAAKNTRTEGPLVKIKDDPRVTRVGKFIRKFSIDELPQLWNVITGESSLVGPRAHLPEEVAKYQKHHRFVFTIQPGITGLAQISGRSDLTFEDEVKLDRFYIENWSILLDLKILFKTIFVVIKGHKE
ncbi:sugar transferase [Candidatus Gracilibacteria bacterium]|nr:sugar transferase [Candidatus Gracilibacteria bacterium]